MSKNFFEKRDLKALTTLSVFSAMKVSNEKVKNVEEKNKIIFITSFGHVIAKNILSNKINKDEITMHKASNFILQNSVDNTREVLEENENDDVLINETSFVLEDVEIKPFTNQGTTYNYPSMILFSDQIVGLSLGSLSEN